MAFYMYMEYGIIHYILCIPFVLQNKLKTRVPAFQQKHKS